jgi:hypothetical protein
VILGKPRSQPKKILQRAKTLSELSKLLSSVSTEDLSEFYQLSLKNRDNIMNAVFRFVHDGRYLKYVQGLTDEEYCSERYKLWLEFRKENTSVANSEEYFRVKYGQTWQIRQAEYRRNKPNTYDISYWLKKGMTEEQARDKVKTLKYETSLSLERCIELHGEVEGRERHKFIHRFHKNYSDYWGDDLAGFTKYKRETNRCTVDFWLKRGYSKEDSMKMISSVQKMYSGLHREFYESRNHSKEEIERIMQSINEKKDSSSLQFCLDRYGNNGLEIYERRRKSKSSCFREQGKLAEELHKGLQGYSARVDRVTKNSLKKIPACPGKRGKHRGEYQVDHRFSKMQGFLNGIDPDIIGHHENLEWVLTEENCSKRMKCSITIEELMEKINENQKNKS